MNTKMSFVELYVACFLLLIAVMFGIVLIFSQTSFFETGFLSSKIKLVKNESIPLSTEVLPDNEKDSNSDIQTIKDIQAEMHLEIIKLVYKPNVYLMKILDGSSVESVIERLQNYKEVKYSEPNFIRSIY